MARPVGECASTRIEKCAFTWIEKFGLWDCTDGKIHGGGKTKEAAYEDYREAVAEETFDCTVGWR